MSCPAQQAAVAHIMSRKVIQEDARGEPPGDAELLTEIAAAAATGSSPRTDTAFPNAAPYLFDEPAVRRAAAVLAAPTAQPATTANPSHPT